MVVKKSWKINDVEITNIDSTMRDVSMLIHLKGISPLQINTLETQAFIAAQARVAIKYLIAEGFIDDHHKCMWNFNIGGVIVK